MTVAGAATSHKNELLLFFTLLELAIIVMAGRVGGAVATRCGQAPAVGEIIIGILLGPSLFGWLAPHAFNFVFHSAPPEPLLMLSQLGLVLCQSPVVRCRSPAVSVSVMRSRPTLRGRRLRSIRRCSWPPPSPSRRCPSWDAS
jgi:predicted Kef-type K+ transport protein